MLGPVFVHNLSLVNSVQLQQLIPSVLVFHMLAVDTYEASVSEFSFLNPFE